MRMHSPASSCGTLSKLRSSLLIASSARSELSAPRTPTLGSSRKRFSLGAKSLAFRLHPRFGDCPGFSVPVPLLRFSHSVGSTGLNPARSRLRPAGVAMGERDISDATERESSDADETRSFRQLEELRWENTFVEELPGDSVQGGPPRTVRNACYSLVNPSVELKDPKLVAFSEELAKLLDIEPSEFSRPEIAEIFSGGVVLKGCKPYAQCYGGHQFGHWAGQLGDGRAITLGEILNSRNQRFELQLKGAGLTPYSRRADGKAVLRSSIREFLASEAMFALGVPTTRALTLTTTGEKVMRDMFYNGNIKYEPGAVVCRVAPTFVRFGSFQIYASRGGIETELARHLADYVIKYHYPHLSHLPSPDPSVPPVEEIETFKEDEELQVDPTKNKYTALFAEAAERTGKLVAAWQAFGFTHGVLNTDNMSILGVTIDYGPFGFMDRFDPQYTPNTTDLPGRRYCFQNQPDIGLWNVVQLANALNSVRLLSVPEAQFCVSRYAETFIKEYEHRMKSKLGLESYDRDQTQALLKLMSADSADFTILFRSLASVPINEDASDEDLLSPLRSAFAEPLDEPRAQAWSEWLRSYTEQVRKDGRDPGERAKEMNTNNPVYIPRNYLCQIAIEAAEAGDFSEVLELLEVMKNPFVEQAGREKYALSAPEWANKPGVCMLSCSS